MKPKTMMLMVVAVGCGLAASYMTSRLLAERNNKATDEARVTVLVAKQKVPGWVLIKDPDKYFEIKEFPEGVAPKKALKSLEEVKDQRLNKPVAEEAFVTTDDLLNKEQAGLAGNMPVGMRAVALKVNAESLAGGFVLPGSRVDVVSTLRGGVADSQSQIILQNMLVLAVDTQAQRDPNQPSILGNTVTLAAKPEEAQRLRLAAQIGDLSLILRPLGDNDSNHLPPSKLTDLNKPIRGDGNVDDQTQVASAGAPPVPSALPTPPEPKEEPKEDLKSKPKEEPKEEPKETPREEQPPVKTHTLTIINGEYVQKAVFVLDATEGWKNGTLSNEDGSPAGKPGRK
jgi:pilus assembly protein CpaB